MEVDDVKESDVKKPSSFFGVRHIQYVLLFTATAVAYGVRVSFSVGVIAITSSDTLEGVPTYPEWDGMRNIMLSSFFWGYIAPQVVAGQLAKHFGAKWFLGATTFLGSLAGLLIPQFAHTFGYEGIIFCRVVQGFAQSFLFPCTHVLLSKWAAIADRSKVGAFTYAGVPLGTLISMPVTGLMAQYEYVGWPASFYLFGAIGMAWSILWAFIGSESPSAHSSISSEEREYIEHGSHAETEKKIPTPWLSIATSLPFWGILICHCGENWGYWTLLTQIPLYMERILNFDIAANSALSALPYLAFWLLSFVMGPIADFLTDRKYINRTTTRKLFTSIAMFVPVITLISVNFVDSSERALTIFLLTLSVGSTAGIFCGYYINHIDLSPNHVGALMGITTMISNICSLLAPLAVDLVINVSGYQEDDKEMWAIVFYIAAGIYLATGLFYDFTASGEVQPWNGHVEKDNNSTHKDAIQESKDN